MPQNALRRAKRFCLRVFGLAGRSDLASNPFLRAAPPGHFYSPIPDLSAAAQARTEIDEPSGLDLCAEEQRELLEKLAGLYSEFPFSENRTEKFRFAFDQNYFCHSDAIYLYGMMRLSRPRQFIEVGSGHSSALALDTNERFLENSVRFTFIEPYPQRLNTVLRAADRAFSEVIERPVQNVRLDLFDQLQANDILFIDSSHVSKMASDVNHLIFRVLPRLRPGVLVHFHDIFYPFEYPAAWLRRGRAWNEAYAVRAFLQYNQAFKIMLFAAYAGRFFRDFLAEKMPRCLRDTGGSLWLRKT